VVTGGDGEEVWEQLRDAAQQPPRRLLESCATGLLTLHRDVQDARRDVQELRREVGLSLPPMGVAGDAQLRRATFFQLRASIRYALVAAAGAGATVLANWLATLIGGGNAP
jgi:hypothetical protein